MSKMREFGLLTYRAICAILLVGIAGFAAAVALGWLEVRRPGLPADPVAKERVLRCK